MYDDKDEDKDLVADAPLSSLAEEVVGSYTEVEMEDEKKGVEPTEDVTEAAELLASVVTEYPGGV